MERYSRQIALLGKEKQELIRKKTVAVVGLGALGSVVSELFARAGVNLKVFDFDKVELSNLQRQTVYDEEDVGKFKAEVMKKKLEKINSGIGVGSFVRKINSENVELLFSDLIVDCTDNNETRLLLNDFALKNKIPLIYGSAVGRKGYVYVVSGDESSGDRGCLQCILKNKTGAGDCESEGIIGSLGFVAGGMQFNEGMKVLAGDDFEKNFLFVNLEKNAIEKIIVKKNGKCGACKNVFDYLAGKENGKFRISFCRSKAALSAKPIGKVSFDMEKLKKKFRVVADAGIVLVLEINGVECVVQKYGEILFKGCTDSEKARRIAEKVYSA